MTRTTFGILHFWAFLWRSKTLFHHFLLLLLDWCCKSSIAILESTKWYKVSYILNLEFCLLTDCCCNGIQILNFVIWLQFGSLLIFRNFYLSTKIHIWWKVKYKIQHQDFTIHTTFWIITTTLVRTERSNILTNNLF